VKKIFIKSVNWVGDAVMVTPAIRAVRRAFPQAQITLLARPGIAEVFEGNPDIDRLWVGDERGSFRRFREIVARMRHERFDWGLSLPNSFAAALLLYLGGVKQRVGYGRDGRGFLLTDVVKPTREILSVHEVEYYLNLLHGVCDVSQQERKLILEPPPTAEAQARRVLEESGLADAVRQGHPLVGICPGAAHGTAKRWLPERFAEVSDRLAERWGARGVVVGAPNEREVGQQVAAAAQHPITVLSGQFPLRTLIALIGHFRLFLTNDCGSMHLAAARNVPLVAVFGPTKDENTAPYHPDARIVRSAKVDCPDHPCMQRHCKREHQCMTSVSVDEVARVADEQMRSALGQNAEGVHRP